MTSALFLDDVATLGLLMPKLYTSAKNFYCVFLCEMNEVKGESTRRVWRQASSVNHELRSVTSDVQARWKRLASDAWSSHPQFVMGVHSRSRRHHLVSSNRCSSQLSYLPLHSAHGAIQSPLSSMLIPCIFPTMVDRVSENRLPYDTGAMIQSSQAQINILSLFNLKLFNFRYISSNEHCVTYMLNNLQESQ